MRATLALGRPSPPRVQRLGTFCRLIPSPNEHVKAQAHIGRGKHMYTNAYAHTLIQTFVKETTKAQ